MVARIPWPLALSELRRDVYVHYVYIHELDRRHLCSALPGNAVGLCFSLPPRPPRSSAKAACRGCGVAEHNVLRFVRGKVHSSHHLYYRTRKVLGFSAVLR